MKYTKTHEWVNEENGIATVGVTDHAQGELGDIVYVELPEDGKNINAGDIAVVLESTKAAADVYSPVSGKVVEVNELLADTSDLVNIDAEGKGWLYKIELSKKEELDSLMDTEQYNEMLA